MVRGGEWLPPDPSAGRHRGGEGDSPRVLTVPASLRSVDVRVTPSMIVAVIVVVLLVGGIFGARWWWAERGSQPVPLAPAPTAPGPTPPSSEGEGQAVAPGAHAPDTPGQPGGDGAQVTDAAPQVILVHVDGAVQAPGVVQVEAGARVQDAVDAAGGLTAEADTTRLNLARPVTDGERLWVPRPGEEVPDLVEANPGAGPDQPPTGRAGGSSGGTGSGGQVQINLNSADQAALEELPGVGPVTAAAIIEWRTEHGRFSTTDELLEVSGIGEATLDKLLPHVTL